MVQNYSQTPLFIVLQIYRSIDGNNMDQSQRGKENAIETYRFKYYPLDYTHMHRYLPPITSTHYG